MTRRNFIRAAAGSSLLSVFCDQDSMKFPMGPAYWSDVAVYNTGDFGYRATEMGSLVFDTDAACVEIGYWSKDCIAQGYMPGDPAPCPTVWVDGSLVARLPLIDDNTLDVMTVFLGGSGTRRLRVAQGITASFEQVEPFNPYGMFLSYVKFPVGANVTLIRPAPGVRTYAFTSDSILMGAYANGGFCVNGTPALLKFGGRGITALDGTVITDTLGARTLYQMGNSDVKRQAYIDALVAAQVTDWYVEVGSNDCAYGVWNRASYQTALLDLFTRALAVPLPFLRNIQKQTMIQRAGTEGPGPQDADAFRAADAAVVSTLANPRLRLVDGKPWFSLSGGYYQDGTHLTDAGQPVYAQKILGALTP